MSNELQTQSGGTLAERPAYLSEIAKEDYGTDMLKQYVSPPFIKIVQKNAGEPYNAYDIGSILSVPLNLELFRAEQEFHILPIFMYPEYMLINPYTMKNLPFSRERSLDPKGEVAQKCRDFANRNIVCPEAPADKQSDPRYMCTYYESINFLCRIEEHDKFNKIPVVFSFRSSEFKTGKNLAQLIDFADAPLYCQRFKAWSGKHKAQGEENYGMNFDNPDEKPPWVSAEDLEFNTKLFEKFRKIHSDNLLQVDYGAEQTETVDDQTPEM